MCVGILKNVFHFINFIFSQIEGEYDEKLASNNIKVQKAASLIYFHAKDSFSKNFFRTAMTLSDWIESEFPANDELIVDIKLKKIIAEIDSYSEQLLLSKTDKTIAWIVYAIAALGHQMPYHMIQELRESKQVRNTSEEFYRWTNNKEMLSFPQAIKMDADGDGFSGISKEGHPFNIIQGPSAETTDIMDAISDIEEKLGDTVEVHLKEVNDANNALKKLIKDHSNDIESRIENAAKAIGASVKLREAFSLWETKEKKHRKLFLDGCALFGAMLFVFVAVIYIFWDGIIETVALTGTTPKTGAVPLTAQLLSRIVLISLPFAIAIWLLRAILRWANLNLSLAEDAAQRAVLAKTYVNLISDGAVIESEDRQIMLNSLFRPLPGIKDLDIPPTTLKDFVDIKSGKR